MASRCRVTDNISADCDALRRVGGVNKRFWLFNAADVTYTEDGSGYVNSLAFSSIYGGLYEFEGKKKSHSGGYTLVKQSGGNTFFQHDVIAKLISTTPADDETIEELSVADVGIILETNNNEFMVYGIDNGLEMTAGTQNSGQESASDITDSLTFQGEERRKPRRFLVTNYQTTLNYLNARVI
ncbi:MAG: hypothetical protein K2X97_07060 [Mycobacteriaceae bacterium]|nr:hypothetical protein [Mycobacteriaceae bacterium]